VSAPAADPRPETRPPRAGEEVDAARLASFLEGRLEGLPSGAALHVSQFPGGHSNLTYLLRVAGVPEPAPEWVLRRPPRGGEVKTAHDMGREWRVLSALAPVYPKAPRPLVSCEDASVIGAPFYVMERVRGLILRSPRQREARAIDAAGYRRLSEAFVDALADLHAVDWRAAGLEAIAHPEGYLERQVRGWIERYRRARTDDVPEIERAIAWLEARPVPPGGRAALVHNDWKVDNMVLDPADPGTIRAVLDWEMATVGDPLLDVGTSLAYWVEAGDPEEVQGLPLGPTALPGNLSRAEIVARYEARTGAPLADPLHAYVFGLVKVATIAQQIYRRFAKGLTRDERFGALILAVAILGRLAERAIEWGRV
jgi:aminoglycoside phosphotransferase (APT) family kinase protein